MYAAHERRAYILHLLEQHGRLRSAELARDLGVTDETIRTDLVELQRQGLLQRTHGGARYILPTGDASGTQGPDALMADILAARISKGERLYLDASPFSLLLAWKLRDTPCKIISPSPKLLLQLGAKAMKHRIFHPGGELEKTTGLILPDQAEDYLQGLAPFTAVLRPHSLSATHVGYSSATQAAWAEAAMKHARRCYAAVPSTAFGEESPYTRPARLRGIITEDNLPEDLTGMPEILTVPYIARESLLPPDRFDY